MNELTREYRGHTLELQIAEAKTYGLLDGNVFAEYVLPNEIADTNHLMSTLVDEVSEELHRQDKVKKFFLVRELRQLLNYADAIGVDYSKVSTGDSSADSENKSVLDLCRELTFIGEV